MTIGLSIAEKFHRVPFDVLGLPLHPVREEELLGYIEKVIGENKKAMIPTLNIHGANFGAKLAWFRDFLHESHLVYCDGDGIRLGLWILGHRPPPKIALNSWIWNLAKFCEEKGFSLYFLGGRKGVPEEASRRLRERFPKLKIIGCQDNSFLEEENGNDIVNKRINQAQPDILIVGLGMPLQERWIRDNWKKVHAHIFMTAGSTVEFVSGRIKMTPQWMIDAHLEWFFRLCQEPRRLFTRYCFGVPQFFFRILIQKWRLRGYGT